MVMWRRVEGVSFLLFGCKLHYGGPQYFNHGASRYSKFSIIDNIKMVSRQFKYTGIPKKTKN